MRKTLFLVLSVALVLSSCKKDKAAEVSAADNWYYLDASINKEQQESKTTIDDGNFGKEIVWDENDKIAVYTTGSDKYVFVQDGEAGGTETRFKYNGTPDFKGEEVYTAIYPESMVSGNAGELVTSWPSEQTVKYGHPMTVAIPMLASGTIVDDTLEGAQFDCLGGILNLVLNIPATGNEGENTGGYLRKIEISADQVLSGDFHFVTDEGQTKMVFEQTASNKITLTFEGAEGEEDKGVFLLPGQQYQTNIMLPPAPEGGYTNWKMVFYDESEELLYTMQSKKALNIKKSTVTPVSLTFAYLHRPALTYSDPAGTIGVLNGRKAVVVDVNGYKFALAMENVGATEISTLGTPFRIQTKRTQEDLDQFGLTDGWRLPTAYEWSHLVKINPERPKEDYFKLYIGDDKHVILPRINQGLNVPFVNTYYALLDDQLCAHIYINEHCYPFRHGLSVDRCNSDKDVYVRPVHDLPEFPERKETQHILTKDDRVGTVGYVSEADPTLAVMMELCGRKVAVATKNIGAEHEFAFGSELNFSASISKWQNLYLENGWTLPSTDEVKELFGATDVGYHPINTPTLMGKHEINDFAAIYIGSTQLVFPASRYNWHEPTEVYLISADYPIFLRSLFDNTDGLDHKFECYSISWGVPLYARAVYEFENITASSPVGTRGKYNDQECVVAMLAGKKLLLSVNCAYYHHKDTDFYSNNGVYCFMDYGTMSTNPTRCSWGDGWRIINENELATLFQDVTNDVTEGISGPYDDGHDSRFYCKIGDYKLIFNLWGRSHHFHGEEKDIVEDTDKLYIMSSTIEHDENNKRFSKGIELQKDTKFDTTRGQVRELSSLYFNEAHDYRYQTFLVHEMPTE